MVAAEEPPSRRRLWSRSLPILRITELIYRTVFEQPVISKAVEGSFEIIEDNGIAETFKDEGKL